MDLQNLDYFVKQGFVEYNLYLFILILAALLSEVQKLKLVFLKRCFKQEIQIAYQLAFNFIVIHTTFLPIGKFHVVRPE